MTDTITDLRRVTDDALAAAREALLAGWRRLSATDVDPAEHSRDVAVEMGALTLPIGKIGRIQHRRSMDDDVVRLLADYAAEEEMLSEQLAECRERIGELVRRAFGEQVPAGTIAEAIGRSRQRVYQIRRGVRWW